MAVGISEAIICVRGSIDVQKQTIDLKHCERQNGPIWITREIKQTNIQGCNFWKLTGHTTKQNYFVQVNYENIDSLDNNK